MDFSSFEAFPVMGILRGIEEDRLEAVLEISIAAGLRSLEVTMNTDNAGSLISKAVKYYGSDLWIGAGTVLDLESLKAAVDAGANYVVTPVIVPQVISYCVKKNIPVFPGAFTPLEIYTAWQSGASMVKLFPAKFSGPAYIQEIKGPFEKIKIMAAGGVTAENIKEFFKFGASAVAFGASIYRSDWIANGEFDKIGASIKKLILNLSQNL